MVRACVHVFVCECLEAGLLQLGEQQGQPLHSATIFKTDWSATVCCAHIHVCHVCVCVRLTLPPGHRCSRGIPTCLLGGGINVKVTGRE